MRVIGVLFFDRVYGQNGVTYECTRHSFGAQWVINGASPHKLSAVLGHSSSEVTQRYSHLVPGEYMQTERALVDLDLRAQVVQLQKRG